MPNEVKLLPCEPTPEMIEAGLQALDREIGIRNEDEDRQLIRAICAAIEAARPTTVVTDEIVERMRKALEQIAISPSKDSPFHPAKAASIARAALASMPTVVIGEQPA